MAAALGGASHLGARTRQRPGGAEGLRRRKPCCSCAHESAAACSPSAALRKRPVMEGGPCPLFVRASASKVVLAKAVSSAAHPGQVLVRGLCGSSSGIARRGVCCRGCGLGSSLDCTKSSMLLCGPAGSGAAAHSALGSPPPAQSAGAG